MSPAPLPGRYLPPDLIAAYATSCAYCGALIMAGDRIGWSVDDDGWVHRDCLR